MNETICVGLPRGLLYHRYGALWQDFFTALGVQTITGSPTNKAILDKGALLSVDEACLSAKIFLGQAAELVGKCDYLFLPRFSNFGRLRTMCTRFEAMPDIARIVFRESGQRFLTCNVDVRAGQTEEDAAIDAAAALGFSRRSAKKAWSAAEKQEHHRWSRRVAAEEALYKTEGVKILVAAHSYVVEDPCLGAPVPETLRALGVTPIRADIVDRAAARKASAALSPTLKWEMSRELAGSIAMHKDKVDGIVLLSAFPCGPDSMVDDMLLRRVQGVPVLHLTLDGQSGTAGVETRLESFVDIIHFKEGTL